MQFFGNNDVTTTECFSGWLGTTRVEVSHTGEVGPVQQAAGQTGRTGSVELHDLLTPEEVSRQFARSDRLKWQLVIWADYHPLILQRVGYFDEAGAVYTAFSGKRAAT